MARAGRPAIDSLALVLAGPIVRRVTLDRVAVWLALREPREVVLAVTTPAGKPLKLGAIARPIALGKRLHVVLASVDGLALTPGARHGYAVYLRRPGTRDTVSLMHRSAVPEAATRLCLRNQKQPSFVAPPGALAEVDIVHGSCRKPHGPPPDAMARLAGLLDPVAARGARPQQLLLTGDQIYADDVFGPLLAAIIELADDLFDTGPTTRAPVTANGRRLSEAELAPYARTRSLGDTLQMFGELDCHLARFEEFAAMYLLVWSEDVWPTTLPVPYEQQRWLARHGPRRAPKIGALAADAEFWRASLPAFNALVRALFDEARAVVVSGDVHYGYAATLDRSTGEDTGRRVPCFICSPLMNSFTGLTRGALEIVAAPPFPMPGGVGITRLGDPFWDGQLARIQIVQVDGGPGVRHTWYMAAGGTRAITAGFSWAGRASP